MKNTVVITGSLGLVGMESVLFFLKKKYNVVGIENDMRNYFFGSSVLKNKKKLIDNYNNYTHLSIDIRNKKKISDLFLTYKKKNSSYYSLCRTAVP